MSLQLVPVRLIVQQSSLQLNQNLRWGGKKGREFDKESHSKSVDMDTHVLLASPKKLLSSS